MVLETWMSINDTGDEQAPHSNVDSIEVEGCRAPEPLPMCSELTWCIGK